VQSKHECLTKLQGDSSETAITYNQQSINTGRTKLDTGGTNQTKVTNSEQLLTVKTGTKLK